MKLVKLGVLVFLALTLMACGAKRYKPDASLADNEKAYIKIDGSKAKGNAFMGASRLSSLNVHDYEGDCRWKFLGQVSVSGDKSSDTLAIRAGRLMLLTFIRSTFIGNTQQDEYLDLYVKPRVGYTYTFIFDDEGRGSFINALGGRANLDVTQTVKGKTTRLDHAMDEPVCEK